MVSLGCDKNRVDTENVLYALTERGYTLTQNVEEADILVVNTCAFITTAIRERNIGKFCLSLQSWIFKY